MKRHLILFVAVSVVLAGAASASVRRGDTELDLLGGWLNENQAKTGGLDYDTWFLSGRVGYFVSDNIQISGAAVISQQEDTWSTGPTATDGWVKRSIDVFGIGGQVKYHVNPTNHWVLYVGGQVLWASVDAEERSSVEITDWSRNEKGILWGPIAGLRYELNANNDFFVEYQYHLWNGDIDTLMDDGQGVFFGITHQFR